MSGGTKRLPRRTLLRALPLVAGACTGAELDVLGRTGPCRFSGQATPPAPSASRFVDFVGVGLRLAYPGTPYADLALVRRRLSELGVRHVADDAARAFVPLAGAGLRLTQLSVSPDEAAESVRLLGGALEAVECALLDDRPRDAAWVDANLSVVRQVRAAAERNGRGGAAVIAPALGDDAARLLAAGLAPLVDLQNVPFAPGVEPPGAWIDRMEPRLAGPPSVALQVVYSTTAPPRGVSEPVQARFYLRALLGLFLRGAHRAFAAQLFDWDAQGEYAGSIGLLRADGTAKPAFEALRNLLGICAAGAAPPVAAGLSYRLDGNTRNVRTLVLHKEPGGFLLIVWLEDVPVDPPETRPLSLVLEAPVEGVSVYHPERSPFPVDTLPAARELPIEVREWPTVFGIGVDC
jgi:hypothetical protein